MFGYEPKKCMNAIPCDAMRCRGRREVTYRKDKYSIVYLGRMYWGSLDEESSVSGEAQLGDVIDIIG